MRYFQLPQQYHLKGMQDGTQWVIRVRAASKEKGIYCNNWFPAEVRGLSVFVHAQILAKSQNAIDAAMPVEIAPMEQWNEFETVAPLRPTTVPSR
jgi:hypothetical protein